MSLNIDQIAEAFCNYRFVVTYPYMADEIKWTIVGGEELMGREAVMDRCDKSAKFLETVSPTIAKLKINRAETFVVVEGAAQFQDPEAQTSSLASCDVFQFSDGRLVEITSYVIELNKLLNFVTHLPWVPVPGEPLRTRKKSLYFLSATLRLSGQTA